MKLLLMRHGAAVSPYELGIDDDHRFLTGAGRDEAGRVGALVAATSGLRLDGLWTSPLVRAVQTAELFAAAVGHNGLIPRAVPSMSPDGSAGETLQLLEQQGGEHSVLALVGHMPSIAQLASALLGRRSPAGFSTGQILALEWPGSGQGQLLWTAKPFDSALRTPA